MPIRINDLVGTLLADFINTDHGMHRDIGLLHILELVFEFFLGRINHQLGMLAEYDILDLNKGIHCASIDAFCIKFVYLALIVKGDSVHSKSIVCQLLANSYFT